MLNGLLTGAYRRDCWLRVVEMEQVAALSRSWRELTQPRCQGGVGVMEGQRGFLSESLLHWTPVTAVGLYWAFVDVVWIVLFPLIYLIGRGGP